VWFLLFRGGGRRQRIDRITGQHPSRPNRSEHQIDAILHREVSNAKGFRVIVRSILKECVFGTCEESKPRPNGRKLPFCDQFPFTIRMPTPSRVCGRAGVSAWAHRTSESRSQLFRLSFVSIICNLLSTAEVELMNGQWHSIKRSKI